MLFTEPMEWASKELADGKVEGKLHCPNERCKAKLGSFNWAGMTCSCGKWITPAFNLQMAKID
jgi:dual specificity phosphatase 12